MGTLEVVVYIREELGLSHLRSLVEAMVPFEPSLASQMDS